MSSGTYFIRSRKSIMCTWKMGKKYRNLINNKPFSNVTQMKLPCNYVTLHLQAGLLISKILNFQL